MLHNKMINFRKDLFIKLCKNKVVSSDINDTVKFDMRELRSLHRDLLTVETTCSNIKTISNSEKERLSMIKGKIKSLKSLIVALEKKAS